MRGLYSTMGGGGMPVLPAKKAGEAPPTAGFFSWLPDLPAPGRPGGRAPLGLAALLPNTEPLDPARKAAIAIVAVDPGILVPRMETGSKTAEIPVAAVARWCQAFFTGALAL